MLRLISLLRSCTWEYLLEFNALTKQPTNTNNKKEIRIWEESELVKQLKNGKRWREVYIEHEDDDDGDGKEESQFLEEMC